MIKQLLAYFSKNAGLNTVTGAIIPVVVQVAALISPALSDAIVQAFTPDVSDMLLSGGAGAGAALVIVAARVGIALLRMRK